MSNMASLMQWLGFGSLELAAPRQQVRVSTPWTESTLQQQAIADVFGGSANRPATRLQAMRVPACTKARSLIVGPLARQPLRAFDGDDEVSGYGWLQHTAGAVSPWHRMAWTLDDIIFYGWSLWAVTRNTEDQTVMGGAIIDAQRVPFDRWRFDESGGVEISTRTGWEAASEADVILIPGPQEGLLDLASDTIRGAAGIQQAWVNRATTPIPLTEIRQNNDDELEDDEIDGLVAAVVEARRRSDTNSVAYTPRGIELVSHGDVKTDMYVEGRNALTLDVARFTALPGSLLDASLATASLTYSTQEGQRNELVDYSLSYWAAPISARLSQDDVVADGVRVRFDLTEFTAPIASPTGPTTED